MALAAYAVLGLITIVAQLVGVDVVSTVGDVLLMPLLAGFVLLVTRERSRLVVLVVVGLCWSWLGDWADQILLMKIGFFLVAQTAYGVAFWPLRRRSVLTRPLALVAYGSLILWLIVALARQAGSLAVPVAVYGVSLGVMVILATGVNRMVGVGAFVFLLSDIVLGVYFFVGPDLIPAALALNSVLYLPAQLLLAVGVVRHVAAQPGRPRRFRLFARG